MGILKWTVKDWLMKLRTHLMLTLPSAVIGQNYGKTSNFQVSSRLTFKFYDTACPSMGKNLMPLARWQCSKSYGCGGQLRLPVWLAVTNQKGCNRQSSDGRYQDHIQCATSAGQVTHKWCREHGADKDFQSWLFCHRWMRSWLFGATALSY